ncbi:MAG: TPM domain-containing protein [Gemmatimonadota bacterium]
MIRRLAPGIAGLLAIAAGFVPAATAQDAVPVPTLERRVTDLTGTLTAQEQAALEQKLAAFEERKGSQIAVLIVPTTAPEAIEQYGIRVADQWKLGREGVDDGALLVVAKDDRALRIEVGYGLEGAMPDAIANRIVEDVIVPRFRIGDFDAGVNEGVDAMIQVIDGEPLPAPAARAPWPSGGFGGEGLGGLLTIGFIMVVVVGSVLRALFGRLPAAVIAGGLTGAIVWVLVASAIAAGVVGVIAFLFTLLGGMPGQRRGGYRRGGWGGGWSTGGGGWGGGSSGGGGWSGGGGGFGGGGASGRW